MEQAPSWYPLGCSHLDSIRTRLDPFSPRLVLAVALALTTLLSMLPAAGGEYARLRSRRRRVRGCAARARLHNA